MVRDAKGKIDGIFLVELSKMIENEDAYTRFMLTNEIVRLTCNIVIALNL